MTPERFRHFIDYPALDPLRDFHDAWTKHGVSAALRVAEREVRRWMAGAAPVPPPVAEWVESVEAFREQNPPPPELEAWLKRMAEFLERNPPPERSRE